MKKILAVAMALTMLFALCVPAFAGTITQGTPDPKEAVVPVKTTYSTSDESFTVSYPAAMELPWGTLVDDTNAAFEYSVVSQLQTGKTITVAVSQAHAVMTSAASETLAYTLAYTLAGDVNVTTAAAVVAAGGFVKTVKVDVAQSAWDAAAINEYTDTVTFAVTVNAAP